MPRTRILVLPGFLPVTTSLVPLSWVTVATVSSWEAMIRSFRAAAEGVRVSVTLAVVSSVTSTEAGELLILEIT